MESVMAIARWTEWPSSFKEYRCKNCTDRTCDYCLEQERLAEELEFESRDHPIKERRFWANFAKRAKSLTH